MASSKTVPALHDYRAITRNAGKLLTTITLHTPYAVKVPKAKEHQRDANDKWEFQSQFVWLCCSQCNVRCRRDRDDYAVWEISAYLLNATDFEHDTAYAFKFDLIGGRFMGVMYGQTSLAGWIRADSAEEFRVPAPDYNPLKHPDTVRCKDKHCRGGEAHVIVPEGCYVPPPNYDLFEQVRGCRVEIHTGIVLDKES